MSAFLSVGLNLETEQRKRRSKVFVFECHVGRDVEMHGSKVPNRLDACRNHSVRHFLRSVRRHGYDTDLNIESCHDALKFANVIYGLAVDFRVYEFFVVVKRRHDIQTVIFKTAVSQKRFSESADTDEYSVVCVVVSQKAFEIRNDFSRSVKVDILRIWKM